MGPTEPQLGHRYDWTDWNFFSLLCAKRSIKHLRENEASHEKCLSWIVELIKNYIQKYRKSKAVVLHLPNAATP